MKRYGYKKGCCKRRGPSVTKYLAKLKSANKGKSFSDNKWPWMALITSFNDVCNGALIHPQWIVTAAHCVMSGSLKTSTSRMFVYVGINDLAYSTSKNKYRVRRTIPHPKYRQMQNDIALIQLTKPVQSRYANFLSFPRSEVTPLDTTCMVVGWGINRSLRISASSNPVHQTDQQIFDMNVCRREFKDDKILKNYVMKKSPKMLCAGSLTEENKICTGYEGSPLICQRCSSCEWYIAGVTSTNRRSSCGKRGHPNLFTQTRAFEDWVCKFIPDLNQSPVKCPYKYGP
ncbi:tryptase beta-2-like [Styela clava]